MPKKKLNDFEQFWNLIHSEPPTCCEAPMDVIALSKQGATLFKELESLGSDTERGKKLIELCYLVPAWTCNKCEREECIPGLDALWQKITQGVSDGQSSDPPKVDHLRILNALIATMDHMKYAGTNVISRAALLSYWQLVGTPTVLTDEQIDAKTREAVDKATTDLQKTLKELTVVVWPILPDHIKQAYRAAGL